MAEHCAICGDAAVGEAGDLAEETGSREQVCSRRCARVIAMEEHARELKDLMAEMHEAVGEFQDQYEEARRIVSNVNIKGGAGKRSDEGR